MPEVKGLYALKLFTITGGATLHDYCMDNFNAQLHVKRAVGERNAFWPGRVS